MLERIGVSIGSGIGGLGLIESTNDNYDEGYLMQNLTRCCSGV